MKVDRRVGQEATVYLVEKISLANSDKLKNTLQSLYDNNYKLVKLDFSKTKMIDSSCLGKLLLFQKKYKENNGELVIINVSNDYIRKMFDLIHLHKVISIID